MYRYLPYTLVYFRIKDVDSLINDSIGNVEMLNQVRRAMKRGEVISVTENDYVQKLIIAHRTPTQEKPIKLDATKTETVQVKASEFVKSIAPQKQEKKQGKLGKIANMPRRMRKKGSEKDESQKSHHYLSKKKMIVFGLVVIIIIAGTYVGTSGIPTISPPPIQQGVILPVGVMLDTDQEAYSQGDIILVNGRAAAGTLVSLKINDSNSTVWTENLYANNKGVYSTIVIAGGPGWSENTIYSIIATEPAGQYSAEFLFTTK